MKTSTKLKIIFLDIDGVLNVYPQGRDDYGSLFHPEFIANLKRIVKATGAHIVISSTWRHSGLVIMKEMWAKRKLPGKIIGVTPDHSFLTGSTLQRGKEIDEWLTMSPDHIHSYVILDDDNDMEPHQLPFFVQTSGNKDHPDCVDIGYGLTNICTDRAIEILNR